MRSSAWLRSRAGRRSYEQGRCLLLYPHLDPPYDIVPVETATDSAERKVKAEQRSPVTYSPKAALQT